jgi:long-chain acyl-CoA synthetase
LRSLRRRQRPLASRRAAREVCAIDAFLRRAVGLRTGQPVAIYRTNDRRCFHWFLAIIRAGGIAVPLNPSSHSAEVRRILAESGTEILVTDKAIFERNIQHRDALDVQTWIQADEEPETMPGFSRAAMPTAIRHFRPPSSIPQQPSPSSTPPAPAAFPKAQRFPAAPCSAHAPPQYCRPLSRTKDLALVALPWSHIMAVSIALYGLMAGIRGCFLDRFDVDRASNLSNASASPPLSACPPCSPAWSTAIPTRAPRSVRVWLSASDHLPSEVAQRSAIRCTVRLPSAAASRPYCSTATAWSSSAAWP